LKASFLIMLFGSHLLVKLFITTRVILASCGKTSEAQNELPATEDSANPPVAPFVRFRRVGKHHEVLPRYLDPDFYREPDGCDFSEFVRQFKPNKLEINCDNIHELKIGKLLGAGATANVYEGHFHKKKVAVKIPKSDHISSERTIKSCTVEAAVLYQLRRAPNVANLLGWCNDIMVLEKAAGTLKELLTAKKLKGKMPEENSLKIALDITKGLQQLHAIHVTHNDIKPSQFLFTHQEAVFLNDFGSMRFTGYSNSNTKCQFYVNRPFYSFQDEKVDILYTASFLFMLRIRHPAMKELIAEASDSDPVKRPSAAEMVKRIEAILGEHDSPSIA